MATTDPYGDLATFKARANITTSVNDAVLLQLLVEASRQIDGWTGRNFNQTAAGTVRVMSTVWSDVIEVDDLVSVSELVTDDGTRTYTTVWTTTDFDLFPLSAADRGEPYQQIRVAPYGLYPFVGYPRGVRITGVWGWPAVPDVIAGATYLQANRLWKRKDAPFGVTGSNDLSSLRVIPGMDPDVQAMIAPFKRLVV
jgi:hypothetical protein